MRQIIEPGDIDQKPGNDLITIECTDSACTDARLFLYSGNAIRNAQDQTDPFDLSNRILIGSGGWKDFTNLATGDQDGDGIGDILARDPGSGQLYLYPGQFTNGAYTLSLATRTAYGSAGWNSAHT